MHLLHLKVNQTQNVECLYIADFLDTPAVPNPFLLHTKSDKTKKYKFLGTRHMPQM